MRFLDVVEQSERVAKLIMHRLWAVTNDLEPAAFLGAAQTERSDNEMPARLERTFNLGDIFASVFGVGEEMKYCTVMPEVIKAFG